MIFFYLLLSLFTIAFVCCFLLNIFFMRKIKQALDFLSFALHSMCIVYNETEMCMISFNMCMAQMYSFFHHGTKTNLLNCLNRSENEDWNAHAQCVHCVRSECDCKHHYSKRDGQFCIYKAIYVQGELQGKKTNCCFCFYRIFTSACSFFTQPIWCTLIKHRHSYIHICLVIYSIPFRNSFDSFCIVLSFLSSLYRHRRSCCCRCCHLLLFFRGET